MAENGKMLREHLFHHMEGSPGDNVADLKCSEKSSVTEYEKTTSSTVPLT